MENVFTHPKIAPLYKKKRANIANWHQKLAESKRLTLETLDGNVLQQLGFHLHEKMNEDALNFDEISTLIEALSDEAFYHRTKTLRDFSNAHEYQENIERVKTIFLGIARQYGDDFEGFSQQLERVCYGIVLTAHPTFSQNAAAQQLLCELASDQTMAGQKLDTDAMVERLHQLLGKTHMPEDNIDIARETQWSQQILAIAQQSLQQIYDCAIEVAQEYFPKQWRGLKPHLISLASWVGYDTDGRTDIGWEVSFGNRLSASITQLGVYQQQLEQILTPELVQQEKKLSYAQQALALIITEQQRRTAEMKILQSGDIKAFGQKLHQSTDRLKNTNKLCDLLDQSIQKITDDAIAKKLININAQMRNYGLCTSHCHLRLNSVQLHNAVWQILGLGEEPVEETTWRRYIHKLNNIFEQTQPVSINVGVLTVESMNAKRLMMLARLMLDYVDDATPIRFLLAECESPFTVLCALYFARLFGVDDKVGISPLFETPRGIAKGGNTIGHLLENPYYRAWVEKRGQIPIEAGYSDAGRFSGQVTAALAIEHLYMKILQEMKRHGVKADLLLFSTHGESIGRGGHPQNFRNRLDYLMSKQVQIIAEQNSIHLIHETSFQGADGYNHLCTPALGLSVMVNALESRLVSNNAKTPDPFYRENDFALSFFQRLRRFNENLFAMPEYGNLLKAGHRALIYKTGSRKLKRQHEAAYGVNANHPSQIRAIPHNTILQQMGWLANSVGGVGSALAENKDWYWDMVRHSPRMRQLLMMVMQARIYSSQHALYANSTLCDPDLWFRLAHLIGTGGVHDLKAQERLSGLRKIGKWMAQENQYTHVSKIVRLLGDDGMELGILLTNTTRIWDGITMPVSEYEVHRHILLVHAVRLALKIRCYHLAIKIPRFAPYAEVSYEDVLRHIFDFDIIHALDMLEKIFPEEENLLDFDEYGNHPTYVRAENGVLSDYQHLHQQIFRPLRKIHGLLQQTGGILTNFMSAQG